MLSYNDNLRFKKNCSEKNLKFLNKKLEEYNTEHGVSSETRFGFVVKNDKNEVIAGTSGTISSKVAYLDILWVHKDFRRQNLGSQLIDRVEEFLKQEGVGHLMLDTMYFQAPDFYKKLGFSLEFEKKNCEKGNSFFCFSKKL